MFTVIIWGSLILLVTNFVTWQLAWRLGVKNGEKWEKYRQETRVDMDNMPYSDRFRKDLLMDPNDPPPMLVRHRRRKFNGQWTED